MIDSGQQDVVEGMRTRSCQKLPRPLAAAGDDSAGQGKRRPRADRRRDREFWTVSPAIWAEVAERRLAAVVLPVGVRDERRRRC